MEVLMAFEAEPDEPIPVQVVGWDEPADLAVLRLEETGTAYSYCPPAEPGYRPALGTEAVLGYPRGEILTIG